MEYKEIPGNMITMAKSGFFDVIWHGCNCMCVQGAGVALAMKQAFRTDEFPLEIAYQKGNINKLGQIDHLRWYIDNSTSPTNVTYFNRGINFIVCNAYTQYNYGMNHADGDKAPFDYEAFTLCCRKINKVFTGKHIGMPKIGSHLAGGDWNRIQKIVIDEFRDCNVTVVVLPN